jgi:hypothetical protein
MKAVHFVLALGLAGAASLSAQTANISFDGFCDGMNITTADGLVGGSLSGCLSGIILGNKSIDYGLLPLNGTTGVVDNVQSSALGSSAILTYYLDFENNTWANYSTYGGVPSLINSGTFTINGKPGAGPASNVPQGNVKPNPYLPFNHNATIQFDGFCDGMNLTFQGDLVGGSLAGCLTGIAGGNTGTDYAVQPFGASGSGVAANVGSNADGEGYLLVYFLDFANRTWANYYTTNGVPTFLRNGTFTVTAGGAIQNQGPPSNR